METAAPYDEIADWYESVFLARQRSATSVGYADALGIDQALAEMLGQGDGCLLEVGCGTGIYADRFRRLGWNPVGVDLSAGMLRHAWARLPVLRGDAYNLPSRSASYDAVVTVMVHTDLPAYGPVLSEIFRVVKPGGLFVHIGVHPCFCGGFADRSAPEAIVIRTGYLEGGWTRDSWTNQGVRDKVGASHVPLAGLLNMMVTAGFRAERFSEGGEPIPIVLSARLRKPSTAP
jgi:ubiquinone/menaquinone biosynthesis C-methylase UbiE